jgi:hypothetical protein
MEKSKTIKYMALFCLFTLMLTVTVNAKTRNPYIVSQSKVAKNANNVMSSYALYDNEITLEFEDLLPNTTYKVYRKEAKKKWKVVGTFTTENYSIEDDEDIPIDDEDCYDGDEYEFVDDKVKENTCYYYKLYSCKTKKYTKVQTYWTAARHPKNVRQVGNKVKWTKRKNVDGYLVYFHKHYSFLDGYYQDNVYYCKKVGKNSRSCIIPTGDKIDGVYTYTKHGGKYYVNWAGVFATEGKMRGYVRNGTMKYVLKHKIRD